MGAGVSVDNSSNIAEQINESTREFVSETNLDCASGVRQLSDFTGTGVRIGGNLVVAQSAALVTSCAQQVTNKQEMFSKIANDVIQRAEQEKGASSLFQLVSVSNAENRDTLITSLSDEYEAITGLSCDTSIEQIQRIKLNDVQVGGDASFTQNATLSGDCQQMADLARKVADSVAKKTEQTVIQTIPGGIFTIIAATVILLAIIGLVGSLLLTKTERGRKIQRRMFPAYQGQAGVAGAAGPSVNPSAYASTMALQPTFATAQQQQQQQQLPTQQQQAFATQGMFVQ